MGQSSCASATHPNIFTRVAYYHSWIAEIVDSIDNNPLEKPTTSYKCQRDADSCGCGYQNVEFPKTRIVGAVEAAPYSWSMMVSINFGRASGHSCGGTILDASHILTAAHCVDRENLLKPMRVTVATGMHNRWDSYVSRRLVDRIYVHPLWNMTATRYLHDIAILHLSFRFDFQIDVFVTRTCLPPSMPLHAASQYPARNSELVVIGWGSSGIDSDGLELNLQQTKINVIETNDNTCQSLIQEDEKQFCAGLSQGGAGNSVIFVCVFRLSLSLFISRTLSRYKLIRDFV